jgi:hypothetical protein
MNNIDERIKELINSNKFLKKQVETSESVQNYLEKMDILEKKTLIIAIEHLGSSYNIEKSIGYQTFISS